MTNVQISLESAGYEPPALLSLFFGSSSAMANYHSWRINEIYSNTDGTVQFIELHEWFWENYQRQIGAHQFLSDVSLYTYPSDLPHANTADQFSLINICKTLTSYSKNNILKIEITSSKLSSLTITKLRKTKLMVMKIPTYLLNSNLFR